MNDTRQDNHPAVSLSPVIGFAFGALVGGALALLLAPASGEKTRRRIGDAARRVSHDARSTFDEARDSLTEAAPTSERT